MHAEQNGSKSLGSCRAIHPPLKKAVALTLALATLLPQVRAFADDTPIIAALQKVKFNGLFQMWYIDNETIKTGSNLQLRRAEMKFSGDVIPQAGFFVMIDPAKLGPAVFNPAFGGNILQDVGVVLKDEDHLPGANLTIGQFKVPFGMEGTASSGMIDTVERSMLSTILKWSDFRDDGIMGTAKYKVADTILLTGYLGWFNGEGPNKADVNNNKDLAARVTADLPEGVHIGGSLYSGRNGTTTNLFERYGGEFAYTPPEFPLMLKAEAATGHQGEGNNIYTYYFLGGYTFCDKIQPVVRWDAWGSDGKAVNDIFAPAQDWQGELTYGLNYFLKGHNAKIQAAYTIHTQNTINGQGDVGGTDRGIFRLNTQVYF